MLTLLGWFSPYFTTQRFLVPIVLFWALVVSAGRKAVTTHCATLRGFPVQILCKAPPTTPGS